MWFVIFFPMKIPNGALQEANFLQDHCFLKNFEKRNSKPLVVLEEKALKIGMIPLK